MARKTQTSAQRQELIQAALAGMEARLERSADWTALEQFKGWGELIDALGLCDGAIMLRSADRGASRAVGVFVGGQKQWTTCVDVAELLALLDSALATFQELAWVRRAPMPTEPVRAPRSSRAKH
jgi:hypothetical protein